MLEGLYVLTYRPGLPVHSRYRYFVPAETAGAINISTPAIASPFEVVDLMSSTPKPLYNPRLELIAP